MPSTIAIIRHNGHTAEADHIGCETDVIDPEILVQCADCVG